MCFTSEFVIFKGYHTLSSVTLGELRKRSVGFKRWKDLSQNGSEPLEDWKGAVGAGAMSLAVALDCPLLAILLCSVAAEASLFLTGHSGDSKW